jgi:hypothetical protein
MRELTEASEAYASIARRNRSVIITSGIVTPARMLSALLLRSVSACSFI